VVEEQAEQKAKLEALRAKMAQDLADNERQFNEQQAHFRQLQDQNKAKNTQNTNKKSSQTKAGQPARSTMPAPPPYQQSTAGATQPGTRSPTESPLDIKASDLPFRSDAEPPSDQNLNSASSLGSSSTDQTPAPGSAESDSGRNALRRILDGGATSISSATSPQGVISSFEKDTNPNSKGGDSADGTHALHSGEHNQDPFDSDPYFQKSSPSGTKLSNPSRFDPIEPTKYDEEPQILKPTSSSGYSTAQTPADVVSQTEKRLNSGSNAGSVGGADASTPMDPTKYDEGPQILKRPSSSGTSSAQTPADTVNQTERRLNHESVSGSVSGSDASKSPDQDRYDKQPLFSSARSDDGSRVDPRFVPKQDGEAITFPSPNRTAIGAGGSVPDVALVPGIQTTAETTAEYGKLTAERLGADTTVIYNQRQDLLSDVKTAAGDSSRLPDPSDPRSHGSYGNGATQSLENWVYDHITSGRDADVICHSEGEIIAGNAISEVKKHLLSDGFSPDDAARALSKIHIASYGGASDDSGQFQDIGSYRRVVDVNDPVANHLGAGSNASSYDIKHHSYKNVYLPSFTPDMFMKSGTFQIRTEP
jgi:hypothetical protein